MKARVLVPLHVTSMWLPVYAGSPALTGSVGAGVVLRPGVVVDIGPAGSTSRPRLPHIEAVLERMGLSARVVYRSPVPLGVGYGVSGAVALGAALGVAAARGSSLLDAARIAHEVEVSMGTGLGDVIAEFYGGGIEVRVKPGAPGVGVVDRIPHPPRLVVLTHDFGFEDTRAMLQRLGEFLAGEGRRIVERLLRDPTYYSFLELSAQFSRAAGFLTQRLEDAVRPCSKWGDGYYAKKGVLVFLTYEDMADEAARCLSERGLPTRRFRLSHSGAVALQA
ncbi:MAG: pantothenate kinase [Pyrobaculum sp.]